VKAWKTRRKIGPHERVIGSLSELAKRFPGYQPSAVRVEEQFPKPALVPIGKGHFSLYYMPDLWAKRKVGQKFYIYEVWDSEEQDKAFFEVFRVAFTPGIVYYHIVCINSGAGSWTKREALSLEKGVLDNLKDSEISSDNVSVAEVDLKTVGNARLLRETLVEQLEF
jgi:hypothetical protein